MYNHIYIYNYTYIYIHMCVCVPSSRHYIPLNLSKSPIVMSLWFWFIHNHHNINIKWSWNPLKHIYTYSAHIYIYVYYYININIHSPFEIIKVPLNHTYHIFPVSLCISHSPIEITFFTVKSASCMDRSTLAHPALERHALPRWTPLDAPQQRNPWHTQDLTVIGGNCVTGKW